MGVDPGTIIAVVISFIAAGSAYASQRASSKASTLNTQTTSRVDMEKDAYNRALVYDTDTIDRQDKEIKEVRDENRIVTESVKVLGKENERLREENISLRASNTALTAQVSSLMQRVEYLEEIIERGNNRGG